MTFSDSSVSRSSITTTREHSHRDRLYRHPDHGLLGGVCAGIADRLHINASIVRGIAAASVGFGGIGIALYVLAWALVPIGPSSGQRRRSPAAWLAGFLIVIGAACMAFAAHSFGVPVSQGVIWPAVLGACGMALVWRPIVGEAEPIGASRAILGALLVAFASASLLHHFRELHSLGRAIGAVAIIATIGGFLVVPWFVRLGRNLASERSARIREQERAELAAHLHDSVLQTLALIQKRAADPREVAGLARQQERELRSWLQERPPPGAGHSLAAALERAAAEVERQHRVPIEVITVGDTPLDGKLEALVRAAREAMTNAAKFAGSDRVDLFAETQGGRVEVFIRDRGVGFDPSAVPADRRGVRDSIIGRMERHSGRASVHSEPGAGTEVELVMEGVTAQ
jgi:phage shock protein PspC (stress-responsive transcriptional regulator)